MISFTPKNWENSPSASTPISASALEDLETRVTDHATTNVAVIGETVELDTTGATDEASALQSAIDAVASQGGGNVLLPATNYSSGSIQIGSLIQVPQAVNLRGQGMRETRILCSDAAAGLEFNTPGGGTNSRGGRVSDFHIDGGNVATTCMHLYKSVNRNFGEFRVSRPAASGIGLLVTAAQNCNVRDFDIEATNALTTGVKVTNSAGSCRFSGFSIVGGDYAGVHVTQDDAGGQEGIGYPEPRYISIEEAIVEHGDPATACAMRVHSARDLHVIRCQLMVATDVPSSGPYTIVEINDSGEGTINQPVFDMCSITGGADPQKDSTGFEINGGTNAMTRILNCNFGNNSIGIDADTGQQVECLSYRGPSTTTMFSGAGTIARRAFAATSITTS